MDINYNRNLIYGEGCYWCKFVIDCRIMKQGLFGIFLTLDITLCYDYVLVQVSLWHDCAVRIMKGLMNCVKDYLV